MSSVQLLFAMSVHRFMRPKGIFAGALLLSLVLFFWIWQRSWSKSDLPQNADVIGSSFIAKGPEAEDKVIVIAKMKEENVDWLFDDLKEYDFDCCLCPTSH